MKLFVTPHEIICNTTAGRDNGEDLANAAHIVHCVNVHEELVEALKLAHTWMKHAGKESRIVEKALAKATGEA